MKLKFLIRHLNINPESINGFDGKKRPVVFTIEDHHYTDNIDMLYYTHATNDQELNTTGGWRFYSLKKL